VHITLRIAFVAVCYFVMASPIKIDPLALASAHPIALALASATAAVLAYVIYYLALHPLAKYNGPPLAKVSNLWKFLAMANGHLHITLHELHQRHGDVVRIGPNTLSIRTPDQVKELCASPARFPLALAFIQLQIWLGPGGRRPYGDRERVELRLIVLHRHTIALSAPLCTTCAPSMLP
jgi:hypothetical protein